VELDNLSLNFNKKPHYSAKIMVDIFDLRQKEDVDYLTALMLKEYKVKKKKIENK